MGSRQASNDKRDLWCDVAPARRSTASCMGYSSLSVAFAQITAAGPGFGWLPVLGRTPSLPLKLRPSPRRPTQTPPTRPRLPQPQTPGANRHLIPALTTANPHTIAGIPFSGQLTKHLPTLQRLRPRPRPPHAPLFTAAAVLRPAALYGIQRGSHIAAAAALPEPHVGAVVLKRDKMAHSAATDVATRWKGPFRRQGGTDTLVHERQMGSTSCSHA
jgi:hypothetical protein